MTKKRNKPAPAKAPEELEDPEAPATLGRKFSTAREAQGMTVEDVAKILRLRPGLVREMEEDDLQSFTHASYARLSMLDYGRLLRLSEEEIRPWLPEIGPPSTAEHTYLDHYSDPRAATRRQELAAQSRSGGNPVSGLLRIVGLVLLLIAIAWIYIFIQNLQRIRATEESRLPQPVPEQSRVVEEEPVLEPTAGPSAFLDEEIRESSLHDPMQGEELDLEPSWLEDDRGLLDGLRREFPPVSLDEDGEMRVLPALPVEPQEDEDEEAVESL